MQEGLTNALKHAPGAAVQTTIDGAPGAGLTVEIVTRRPLAQLGRPEIPGAGAGLIGLGERVSLAGGRLEHGRTSTGDYRLWAWLPWPGMTAPIRVLIVDDDALVRAGLAMMLGGAADLEIVGEAEDGTQVVAAIDAHRPDVVLMDIRMPKLDGLAATRLVRARAAAPQVIVLTTFDDQDHVLTALRDGAAGFLVKDTPPAEILRAIRLVAGGEAMLSPAVTRRLLDHMANDAAPASNSRAIELLGELTDREREVAAAVGQGKSNAEIAAELYMSVATVKAHVSRLLMKLDLDNRVHIALLAHDAGLSSPGAGSA